MKLKYKSLKYDPETIQKVLEMAKKGLSDSYIAEDLNVSYSLVQNLSTKYWKQKMEDKNEDKGQIKIIEEKVDEGKDVSLSNTNEDEIIVWFQAVTNNYCIMLNAKVVKATKTWKPIVRKLTELKAELK